MYNINAVALNLHDHNTYDGKTHNQRSRHTRFKYNLPYHVDAYRDHPTETKINVNDYRLNDEFIKEYFKHEEGKVLAFTYTQGGIKKSKDELFKTILKYNQKILSYKPKKLWDYYFNDDVYYIDHHQSHAAYAFLLSGYAQSDILAIDGIGAEFRAIFVDKDKNIIDLSKKLPLGWLWNQMSKITGFGPLGAGKLMGLVGYGKYSDYYKEVLDLIFEDPNLEKSNKLHTLVNVEKYGKEDLAFTLQKFTLDKIKEIIYPLKTCNSICLSGGVAYNGYMNEMFTEHYDNVFVPPAVGDEGQALGTYMHADFMLNNRYHKPDTFAGTDYVIYPEMLSGLKYRKCELDEVAREIANGKIVGWYQGRSESGNRALGNRSILADPRNPNIKDIINHTIKKREDFRPFAPAVLEEYYKEYFDTKSDSPYMSRIVKVISDKIPGVTHVDKTARIQTVNKDFNKKFYNLIMEFNKITGIPMLLNTSFNCKEPIVETPEHAIRTFKKTALDILVINDWIIRK